MGCACFSQNKVEQITTQSQFRFRMKSSFVFFYDNFFWYRAILCLINGRKESFSALLFSIMIFVFAACCWYVDFLIYLLLKRLMLFVKISSFEKIRTWFSEREKILYCCLVLTHTAEELYSNEKLLCTCCRV